MRHLVWFAVLLAACASPAPAVHRATTAPVQETQAPLPAVAGDWIVTEGDNPKVVWSITQDGPLITGSIKPVEDTGLPIAPQPIHGQFVAYGAGWQGRLEAPDGILTLEDGTLHFCPTVGSAIGCRIGRPKDATPGPSGKPPLIHG